LKCAAGLYAAKCLDLEGPSVAPGLLRVAFTVQTILLVDAPDGDASLLASALRVEGFQVILAGSASDARAALEHTPVALALVDLMLRTDAATNGLELAREIKQGYPGLRVLLTSAYYLSERQLERADCGVSGFIPKPYDIGEVVSFIRAKVSGPPSSRRLWHAEASSGVLEVGNGSAKSSPPPSAGSPLGGAPTSSAPLAGARARR
jgi:DNA-binding response OmpR family regulator